MSARCKVCLSVGQKLFLKGEKCYSTSCPVHKKSPSAPIVRDAFDRYWIEKRKLLAIYGVRFGEVKKYAERCKNASPMDLALFQLLEKRLDNVIYRCGVTSSRRLARQLVSHGKIKVNDKVVDVPSFQVSFGDVLTTPVAEEKSSERFDTEWIEKLSNSSYKIVGQPSDLKRSLFDAKIVVERCFL